MLYLQPWHGATPEIVRLLLHSGASPNVEDRNGFDPFMYACYYGRNSNIKFWLKQFKKWDIHRGNRATGANALTLSLNQSSSQVGDCEDVDGSWI